MRLSAAKDVTARGGTVWHALPLHDHNNWMGSALYWATEDDYGTYYWRIGPLNCIWFHRKDFRLQWRWGEFIWDIERDIRTPNWRDKKEGTPFAYYQVREYGWHWFRLGPFFGHVRGWRMWTFNWWASGFGWGLRYRGGKK